MNPLIRKALCAGVTPAEITAKYAISAKQHPKYPQLWMMKYNQIASDMSDPLVQQCRGIILDEADDWRVISRPFDKFFNYGEGRAAKIDWASARVQEKLDGSLISVYWYDGAWQVASSGTPDASGPVKGYTGTFKDLFLEVVTKNGYILPSTLGGGRDYTYMFELMTMYNRIVVRHPEPKFALIGVRDRVSGREFPLLDNAYQPLWFDGLHKPYPTVREFVFKSIDEIEAAMPGIDALNQEGFVVVDGEFNRVKIKLPAYVALHQMADRCSPKAFLEVVRNGEIDEVLNAYPEWTEQIQAIKKDYDALIASLVKVYDANKATTRQKEFAMSIKVQTRCTAALFSLRQEHAKDPSIDPVAFFKKFIAEMMIKSLMSLLGMRDEIEDAPSALPE